MIFTIFAIMIGLSTAIGFYNYITATRLVPASPKSHPFISILIPARNEEKNIRKCINSVLAQKYPAFEILVYDDLSQDGTAAIVKSYGSNVKLLTGKKLPFGWTGKNWACHNLARQAQGELLLFIDADVTLKPNALPSALAIAQQKKVSMLSCFPCQQMNSWGEWLIIPLIDWLSLSFIPLDLIYRTTTPALSLAIGQFILIEKKAYLKIGGHEAIKNKKSDDTHLAKNMKIAGKRIIVVRSQKLVLCTMYQGFRNSFYGLSASFYAGTHLKPRPYVLSLIAFASLFFLPLALYISNTHFLYLLIPLLLQRIATAHLSGQNIAMNLLLLPIHGIMVIAVGIYSLVISLTSNIVWKGRRMGVGD